MENFNRLQIIAALASGDIQQIKALAGIKTEIPTYYTALHSGVYIDQQGDLIKETDLPKTAGYVTAIIVTLPTGTDLQTLKNNIV